MRNKKEPALNVDLWKILLSLLEIHNVKLSWVKGHAGHPENERCDRLAVEAIQKYGLRKGSFLAIKRIFRCNPYCKGGYDPVP